MEDKPYLKGYVVILVIIFLNGRCKFQQFNKQFSIKISAQKYPILYFLLVFHKTSIFREFFDEGIIMKNVIDRYFFCQLLIIIFLDVCDLGIFLFKDRQE